MRSGPSTGTAAASARDDWGPLPSRSRAVAAGRRGPGRRAPTRATLALWGTCDRGGRLGRRGRSLFLRRTTALWVFAAGGHPGRGRAILVRVGDQHGHGINGGARRRGRSRRSRWPPRPPRPVPARRHPGRGVAASAPAPGTSSPSCSCILPSHAKGLSAWPAAIVWASASRSSVPVMRARYVTATARRASGSSH